MRRATPSLPVTPVMLRHFAVLTLVITSCIAIFAKGENREFVQQQMQVKSPKANAAPAQVGQASQPKVIGGLNIAPGTQLGGAGGGGGYVETGVTAGDDSGGGGGGGYGGGESAGFDPTGGPPMAGPMPGMPPGVPPPPSAIENQGPPPGAGPPRKGPPRSQPPRKPTAEEIDRMIAAARERSAGSD